MASPTDLFHLQMAAQEVLNEVCEASARYGEGDYDQSLMILGRVLALVPELRNKTLVAVKAISNES